MCSHFLYSAGALFEMHKSKWNFHNNANGSMMDRRQDAGDRRERGKRACPPDVLPISRGPIHRRLGTKWTYCLGCALIVPAAVIAPLFGRIWLWESMLVSAILVGTGEGLCYLSTIMCLTDAVGPRHYGLIHGVAGCLGSVLKTVAPIISGAVWEWGVDIGAIWVIFVVVAGVAACGVLISARMGKTAKWMADDEDSDERRSLLI
ncbi:hypothetical protein BDZ88DRAFT_283630 [Geranomyces variabilis]|nr:hypothetical protein BDZ88DRAFT_283630 [Geranomyces variabilis]